MPSSLRILMRDESRNYEELATDYAQAGNWEDALAVVNAALTNISAPSTMLLYYKAWFLCRMNQQDEAVCVVSQAENSPLYGIINVNTRKLSMHGNILKKWTTASLPYYEIFH